MALATLSIDLEARLAKLDEGMNKAARLTEKQSARMDAALAKSRDMALAVGATIGGALSAAGLSQLFLRSIDAVDALNDVKDATGASIESISALEDVAMRTGGTLDDVSSVLIKFNGVLKEANGKNGVSMALKAIGLDAAELRKLDPAEALRRTAVALSGFADDGDKARIVQELFGKSVKEAAPFLNDLAAAGKLNATVTTAQAEQAEKFNKQLFAMRANVGNLTKSIASGLVPAINDLFDGAKEFGDRVEKRGLLGAFGDDLKDAMAQGDIDVANEKIDSLRKTMESLRESQRAGGNTQYQVQRIEMIKREIAAQESLIRVAKSAKSDFYGGRGDKVTPLSFPDVSKPAIGSVPDTPDKSGKAKKVAVEKDSEVDRYLENLQKQIERTKDLTVVEQVLLDIENKRIGSVDAAAAGRILDLAEQLDLQKRTADLQKSNADLIERLGDEWEAVGKSAMQANQAAERFFEATLTPSERLAISLQEINALYEKGAFKSDEWGTAEQKRDRVIQKAINSTNELSDSAKNYAQTMLEAVQRGDDLGKALEQIAMKAFIFEPLSNAIDGLFSGAGNPAAAGASSGGFNPLNLVGSLLSTVFGGFFADGGDPPVGKVSVVGERGPELFMPKSAGTIIPNGGFGQSVVINQQISIGEGVSANGVMAAMVQTKAATVAEVMQVLRGRGVPV